MGKQVHFSSNLELKRLADAFHSSLLAKRGGGLKKMLRGTISFSEPTGDGYQFEEKSDFAVVAEIPLGVAKDASVAFVHLYLDRVKGGGTEGYLVAVGPVLGKVGQGSYFTAALEGLQRADPALVVK